MRPSPGTPRLIPEASAQAYDTPKSGTFLQDGQVNVLPITPRALKSTARPPGALVTSAAREAYLSPSLGR